VRPPEKKEKPDRPRITHKKDRMAAGELEIPFQGLFQSVGDLKRGEEREGG